MPTSPDRPTDAELMADSVLDAHAFHQIYLRHARRVHAAHLRQTRDEDAAHDLTAETFARAWMARESFRDEAGGSALPWVLGIARNVVLMSVRRRQLEQGACERLGVRERLDEPPATAEPSDAWLAGVEEAFGELPEGQREAVRLRVLEDRDYAGVAAALHTTEQTARVRVHRALRAMRARLSDPEDLRP